MHGTMILKFVNILVFAFFMGNVYTVLLNVTLERELYDHLMAKFELLTAALMRSQACGMTPYIFVNTYQSTRHHTPEY